MTSSKYSFLISVIFYFVHVNQKLLSEQLLVDTYKRKHIHTQTVFI